MESKTVNLKIFFPEEDAGSQSIIDLITNIKFSVGKVLGKKYPCNISSLFFADDNTESISEDDYYLIILGGESNNSEKFQKQLSILCSKIIKGDGIKESPKLFKLLLEPNKKAEQPECLKPYLGYEFFEVSIRGKSTKPIDISSRDFVLWTKILDIAYDFKQKIEFDYGEKKESKFVYIAGNGDLSSTYYSNIKRELQYYGYRILPIMELPEDYEERSFQVKEYMEASQFVIQVIGQKYGSIIQGEKTSINESESNLIQEYLEQNNSMVRLIWHPIGLKITDPKQSLFLNRLMKSGVGTNSLFFNVTLQELIDAIERFIYSPSDDAVAFASNEKKTYLMAQDDQIKQELEGKINELNCTLVTEEDNKDTTHAYLTHLENIKTCDNIVIHYTHQNWLYSRLGDIIKAKGMGRSEPWNSLLVFGKEHFPLEQYTIWLPYLKLFDDGNLEDFEKQMKALL